MEKFKTDHPDLKINWHLIGRLQTNKSKLVVGKYETIQSVDRIDLAQVLNTRAQEAGVVQNIFIRLNLETSLLKREFCLGTSRSH